MIGTWAMTLDEWRARHDPACGGDPLRRAESDPHMREATRPEAQAEVDEDRSERLRIVVEDRVRRRTRDRIVLPRLRPR